MTRLPRLLALVLAPLVVVAAPLPGTASARPAQESRAASSADATEIATTGLERGERPRVPYLRGEGDQGGARWRLLRADGTALRVPAGWRDFTTLGRGAIGSYGSEAGVVVQRVAADGTVVSTRAGLHHYGLVTPPDQSVVGYLDNRERLVVWEDRGRRRLRFGSVDGVDEVGAILGSTSCREEVDGGCTVFLNRPRDRGARYLTSHGIVDRVPEMLSVTDADQRDRLVGLTSRSPRCSGLLAQQTRVRWTTCDYELTDFSPSGRRVLGTDDPSRVERIAVFAAGGDGTPLVELALPSSYTPGQERRLADVVWEDDAHLLAVVFERGHWSVLRLGLDGSVERATSRLPGNVDDSRYRLPIS